MENKEISEKLVKNRLKILEWDSNFFGFQVAQLDCSNLNEEILKKSIERAKKNKITCIYCLVDSKKDYKKILESFGFYFILKKRVLTHIITISFNSDIAELANEKDKPQIKNIARKAFRGMTRFYKDPHFNKKKVDELYEIWIDKLIRDKNSTIIIIRENNEIVAFNGISINECEGRIELIAVDKKYKNQGYGEKIMKLAQNYFRNASFKKNQVNKDEFTGFQVKVITQDINIPALNFYKKIGFIDKGISESWFHWWNLDVLRST